MISPNNPSIFLYPTIHLQSRTISIFYHGSQILETNYESSSAVQNLALACSLTGLQSKMFSFAKIYFVLCLPQNWYSSENSQHIIRTSTTRSSANSRLLTSKLSFTGLDYPGLSQIEYSILRQITLFQLIYFISPHVLEMLIRTYLL